MLNGKEEVMDKTEFIENILRERDADAMDAIREEKEVDESNDSTR